MSHKVLLRLIDSTDTNVVGGKASALGMMLRAGFKVPNGFVLSSNTFNKMNPALEKTLLRTFDNLGTSFVAVRSSAINEDSKYAAWAGQLDTFLNCSRGQLIQKVRSCWESVNTTRAKSYALQKGIKSTPIAVIVQEMIDSDFSGVAFSTHPVTGDKNQVVIEAVFGLGEAVVSGQVTPDTYIIDKWNGQLTDKHLGTQKRMLVRSTEGKNVWRELGDKASIQKLSEEQIIAVCTLTQKLEEFFKYPVDVEWAIKNDVIYILQCRPITTSK